MLCTLPINSNRRDNVSVHINLSSLWLVRSTAGKMRLYGYSRDFYPACDKQKSGPVKSCRYGSGRTCSLWQDMIEPPVSPSVSPVPDGRGLRKTIGISEARVNNVVFTPHSSLWNAIRPHHCRSGY